MYRLHRGQPRAERVVNWLQQARLAIDVSSIVIHKANKPDIAVNSFDPSGLAGKDRAEVYLSAAQTNAVAISDDDVLVVRDNR
jgi:hypothetical protein